MLLWEGVILCEPGDLPRFLTQYDFRVKGLLRMRNDYHYIWITICCLLGTGLYAQIDSLQVLPEVVLSDVKLRDFSKGNAIQHITDSTITRNVNVLTQLLQQESVIYFRENGPGGVSSASLRGTSAAQTAVVWNGININSQLNGQTDFNTIATRNYDNLSVRTGGGSIPYGSGAIGGSVHLNNDIPFGARFENDLILSYGSFNTPSGHYKSAYGTDDFYIDASVDYRSSDNDFEYLDTNQSNENGDFENTNLNLNLGVKLIPGQLLKVYHNSYLGNRNFSGTLTAPSNDGFKDRNTRSLVEWEVLAKKYDSKLRAAHIFEQFQFFPSGLDVDISTIGKANRFTVNYDFTYRFSPKTSLKTVLDYTTTAGNGTNIERSTRNVFSAVALWNHKLTDQFSYGVQARQEVTENYDSPFLVGLGAEYAFAKAYTLSINASQNYRIPTFNDIYWRGAGAVGNPELLPETANQLELGHRLIFKNIELGLQTYYNEVQDLIVWRPNAQGIWSPINVNATEHYGAELQVKYRYSFNKHALSARGNYAYTQAINKDTGDQLIFVPEQKTTASLGYQFKKWSAYYQFSYTDEVFTTSDNTVTLEGYAVSNLGVEYLLFNKTNNKLRLALRANNILNKNYQTVAFRPNPGRNFLIQTTYKF